MRQIISVILSSKCASLLLEFAGGGVIQTNVFEFIRIHTIDCGFIVISDKLIRP